MTGTAAGEDLSNLNDMFAAAAARFPSRAALADHSRELSYSQLDIAVQGVADTMTSQGIRQGAVVAVRLEPSVELVITLLAVLRVGACYLSLDPSGPAQRAQFILEDARPCAIVEAASSVDAEEVRLFDAAVLRTLIWAGPTGVVADPTHADAIAYVIYTSGTTGKPKGVPVTHRNVVALFAATAALYDFDENDRWLLFHSAMFDFSVWEIWGALSYGGRLFVPDKWTVMDPLTVAQVVSDEQITVLNQTPTAFNTASRELIRLGDRMGLRYIIFGGERLHSAILKEWVAEFGYHQVALVNMYGITETTVHATFRRIRESDYSSTASVIGSPLPGFHIAVVDENGDPAIRGEILLSGPQVVAGYLNRPELTAERFRISDDDRILYYHSGDIVEYDAHGDLRYIGRTDEQVKVRGHRIELGEVEAAFLQVSGVLAVCAVLISVAGRDMLACVYTTENGEALTDRFVRTQLRAVIPDYMIPERLACAEALPRNHNGKIDLGVLRALIGSDVVEGAPESDSSSAGLGIEFGLR